MGDEVGDENVSCVICNCRSNSVNRQGNRGGGGDAPCQPEERGFLAFCKLLKIALPAACGPDGGTGNPFLEIRRILSSENDNGERGGSCAVDNGTKVDVPLCRLCAIPILEICRLDKLIEDLKVSQMVHVTSLKRCLLESQEEKIKCYTPSLNWDISATDSFWRLLRSQLIECLKMKSSVVSLPRLNSSEIRRQQSKTSPHGKRQNGKCTSVVKTEEVSDNDVTVEEFFMDNPDDTEYLPSPEMGGKEQQVAETLTFHTDPLSSSGALTEMEDVAADVSNVPRDTYQNIHVIQENLYLYRCSFFRWCVEDRRLICQHPNCHANTISGNFLDGSLFDNMKSHADRFHSIESPDGIKCGLCSKTFTSKPFRSHVIQEHLDVSLNKCPNRVKILACQVCGRNIHIVHVADHAWTHRNFHENVAYIRDGGVVPHKIREDLKKKNKKSFDPLYSIVFGQDEVYKRRACANKKPKRITGSSPTPSTPTASGAKSLSSRSKTIVRRNSRKKDYATWAKMELESGDNHEDLFGDNPNDPEYIPSAEMEEQEELSDDGDPLSPVGTLFEVEDASSEPPDQVVVTPSPREMYQNIYVIQDNLYLYRCSFFRWCVEDRRLICQHPRCQSPITGNFLDGSLFENVKSHAETEHSSGHPSEGIQCDLCSEMLVSAQPFRSHVIQEHMDVSLHKCPNRVKILACPVCGKNVHIAHRVVHAWSHWSLPENVAHIQGGGVVPHPIREDLKKKFQHPLYPFIFGQDGVYKRRAIRVGKRKKSSRRRDDKIDELPGVVENPNDSDSTAPPKIEETGEEAMEEMLDDTMVPRTSDEETEEIDPTSQEPTPSSSSVTWERYKNICVIQKDLYLYRCSFFKWCGEERRLICQHPHCHANMAGTFLDGSLFQNMKSHVEAEHSSSHPSERIQCALCSETGDNVRFSRTHVVKEHTDLIMNKAKDRLRVLGCQVCGRGIHIEHQGHHAWTHKSFPEQVAIIRRGGFVPQQVRKDVEKKKSHPLYSVMFGNGNKVYERRPTKGKTGNLKKSPYRGGPVSCLTCGKVQKDKYQLRYHQAVHVPMEARKKFPCPHCPRQLLSPVALENHIVRLHRPDLMEFRECPVSDCGKKFFWRDYTKFLAHLRRHKGETPWICDLCGRGFYAQGDFKKHMSLLHLREEASQCEICGKSYSRRTHMLRHKRAAHTKAGVTE